MDDINQVNEYLRLRLSRRRHALGLTLAQVGKRVGAKPQQIHKYETGQNKILAARLAGLARALGVPVGYFFDGLDAGKDLTEASAALAPSLARAN